MKILFVLICSLLIISCSSPNSSSSMTYQSITDGSGEITEEGYINEAGEKNGPWINYQVKRNAKLVKSIGFYQNGKLMGPYVEANDNSNVIEKSWFADGTRNGEMIKYNRTRLKEKSNFKNGELEGSRTVYFDTGKIMEEGTFVNGKREGSAKWYDQDENIKFEYIYENGEKVDEVIQEVPAPTE